MVMKSNKTGMVYPDNIAIKAEPPRKYGALEIHDEKDRQIARRAFQSMVTSHICYTSSINGPETINAARMQMVTDLAKLFLGDDIEFEVWC